MTGSGRRLTTIAALALAALAVTASSGAAAASPARTGILGVVPHESPAPAPVHNLMSTRAAIGAAAATTLSFDSSYETLINRYFSDVAHDSGGTQNVYSVATQYYDNPGQVHIQYQSTAGGSSVDHDPLPANGCDDLADSYCLTDHQLQLEIQAAMTAKGWQGGLDHIFFLMTPEGVGSCEFAGTASSSNPCSTNAFCAYHSAFGSPSSPVVYANEPYLGEVVGCAGPDQGFPNDQDADTTINTISHEHNESITDPLGDGWIAADGNEEADLCAYIYGTPLRTVPTNYNQVIDGHKYDLQEEYSNAGGGCVQHLGGPTSPPNPGDVPLPYNGGPVIHTNTTYAIYWLPTSRNTAAPVVTGAAQVGQSLTATHGTWSDAPTGYSFQWQRCSAAGATCTNISGARAATYKLAAADAGHRLRAAVTATNVNGASQAAVSSVTALVSGSPPVATKPPRISGKVKVGKTLTASKGTWTASPKTYRFQWLRCNGSGASCRAITHAAKSKYKLTKKDAKHRLRVRVTAKNGVGSKAALSRATATVPAAK